MLDIQAVITSLKAAADISKSILKIKSMTEIQDKIAELQDALLKAQNSAISATNAQLDLQEKVRKLEEQLKAANDWGDQKRRYSLATPWGGAAQVYALKRSVSGGEEPHFLCANCFHNKRRVILNPTQRGNGWVLMACPSCKATLETGYREIESPKYAEEYENGG